MEDGGSTLKNDARRGMSSGAKTVLREMLMEEGGETAIQPGAWPAVLDECFPDWRKRWAGATPEACLVDLIRLAWHWEHGPGVDYNRLLLAEHTEMKRAQDVVALFIRKHYPERHAPTGETYDQAVISILTIAQGDKTK